MTTREMSVEEHVRTALEFLEESGREFDAGGVLQASEKLWGAASHAVMAAAKERGWEFGQHYALGRAVAALADESSDPSLAAGFSVAEKFHANFYHNFMEEFTIAQDRAIVAEFVHRVTGQTLAPGR